MKLWIAAFFLLLSSGTVAGENGGRSYPTPPDVNILGSGFMSWQITELVPTMNESPGTMQPEGNILMRAEYGVEPGGNSGPRTERGRFRSYISELTLGGGNTYPELNRQTRNETRHTLAVENAGNRTIKTIEWEYAWIDNPPRGTAISDLLNRASWQKTRSNITIQPGVKMYLRGEICPLPRKGKSKVQATFASGVRITRVIYATGEEWRTP
jgi:hypothetical protein